ncbi:MAG: YggU family protein [Proteobacteria bacterium]|nr:YggU family protein [Pseudomonadota bacterium]MBU1139411.1 YggU family protein [Pseudomonadota bacterium]
MSFLATQKDGRVLLHLYVLPRSSRNGLRGIHENSVKLAITAPPVDGRANAAVISFLTSFLGLKKKDIEIKYGLHSRNKGVLIDVMDGEEIRTRILSALSI